jgi:hypothetical protein
MTVPGVREETMVLRYKVTGGAVMTDTSAG